KITNLFAPNSGTSSNSTVNGINNTSSIGIRFIRNLVTNLVNNGIGTTAIVSGYTTSSSGADSLINNMFTNILGTENNANGILGYSATSNANHIIWNNTFYMPNLASQRTNFGATGIMFPSNLGLIDVRNNIIHLDNAASNAGPLGTGTYAALRNATNATAGVAPTNLNAVNNIYFTPNITNSFL
ncbi:hypothetical protein DI09_554p10, partial [Mitosporidium daphniae]